MPETRVEVAGGLIGQHDARLGDERACDSNALLLSARELAGVVTETIAKPNALERLSRTAGALRSGDTRVDERQLHVGLRGCPREQVERLEDESDALVAYGGEFVGHHRRDFLALDLDTAGGRSVEQADDVHERRLAGARGSHDREHLAIADLQVDTAESVHLDLIELIDLGDSLSLEDGASVCAPARGDACGFFVCHGVCCRYSAGWTLMPSTSSVGPDRATSSPASTPERISTLVSVSVPISTWVRASVPSDCTR